ncbi:ribonuclease III family protein [Actinacidiphila oryziradicis]|nr:hypothetical protein [Actinacidiphila oryziradicis]
MFALPETALPLLSQAFIHASWAYENSAKLLRYRQQNNQVLAFVGSNVVVYEDALVAAQQAVLEPPEQFSYLNLDNKAYDDVFREAGLENAVLLGAGQAGHGISLEMGANFFQAILGAVYVGKSLPNRLAPYWPSAWAPIWRTITSSKSRSADPTTLLERAASAMQLRIQHHFNHSGPDHAILYRTTVILDSEALGISTRVLGPATAGKTQAKQNASAVVLQILERLARPYPAQELADTAPDEKNLGCFLLAHQAAVLSTSPVSLQRWITSRLFGLHFAQDPAKLVAWAGEVDELLDSRTTMGIAPLRDVFGVVLEGSLRSTKSLDERLADAVSDLERIITPEFLSREFLDQLVQLGDVHRCLGREDQDTDLPALADDWQILYRGRLAISKYVPNIQLTGRERAILDAAVSTVLIPGATATVEVSDSRPLRIRFLSGVGSESQNARAEGICALWSGVSRTTTLSPVDEGIEVVIRATEAPADPAPLQRLYWVL